jgi:hypothetical protein
MRTSRTIAGTVAGFVLTAALAGCADGDGDGDGDGDQGSSSTAASVADTIQGVIPDLEATTITEDNDPNDLLGRPNGYVAAVVLEDPRLEGCGAGLGVDCGATIEEWPVADAAQQRAEYIATLQEEAPILGSEYHYLDGAVLVRVSGELKPSEAEEYEAAVE